MKELINTEIKQILLDKNNQIVKFIVEDELATQKELVYIVKGDCCSESWWTEIIGISNLNNKCRLNKVVDIISMELGRTYKNSKQEVDQVKAFFISFGQEEGILLHYRNSSNGYYGGWCSLLEDFNYIENVKFEVLEDDYYEYNGETNG